MKLVFLADAPYPHTWRWVQHFARAGADCEVISFRPFEIEGARVHHVAGGEKLGKARYLLHARGVARLVRSLEPDIVHALHLTSYGFLAALAGVHPLLISVWGTDVLEAPRLTPFHAWLTRYALARADAVTATGLHLATETTRYLPRGRPVNVVPYGADLDLFQPAPRLERDMVLIGAASRLSPEKGIFHLLDAFALLRQRLGGRVRLAIAGEGPERPRAEAKIKALRLEDTVELRGWVEHKRLPAFLQELDVFVLPSTYEGFGVAAVEASAMELPVVASDVHGIPDVVSHGKTGLLVPPADPVALAEAIERLVVDRELRLRLGRAGRAYVSERYDWRRNATQMEAVYERLLASERAKVPVWS